MKISDYRNTDVIKAENTDVIKAENTDVIKAEKVETKLFMAEYYHRQLVQPLSKTFLESLSSKN